MSALPRRPPAPAPARARHRAATLALGAALLAAAFAPLPAAAFSHGFLDDGFEYALYDPRSDGRNTFLSSADTWEKLERQLENEKVPVFWFSDDGRSWLVRDPATVAEARRMLAPVHELAKKQGKLGARQGALGAKQGRLGAQQGKLGARQAMIGVKLSGAVARSNRRGKAYSSEERRRLEDEMEELGREQERLGRLQEPLGEQQRVLGEQQGELGKRQASASKKAGADLRRLAERAREDGSARRLD